MKFTQALEDANEYLWYLQFFQFQSFFFSFSLSIFCIIKYISIQSSNTSMLVFIYDDEINAFQMTAAKMFR